MYPSKLDLEIIVKVKSLNGEQKTIILDYLKNFRRPFHSHKIYRKKAMKQIRKALDKPLEV